MVNPIMVNPALVLNPIMVNLLALVANPLLLLLTQYAAFNCLSLSNLRNSTLQTLLFVAHSSKFIILPKPPVAHSSKFIILLATAPLDPLINPKPHQYQSP